MRVWRRAGWYSAALAAVLAAVVTVSAGIGPVSIPARTVLSVLANAVAVPVGVDAGTADAARAGVTSLAGGVSVRYVHPFAFPVSDVERTIVMRVRLPRILLGALVGTALAAAGTVMQGFFRNPMADPSIVGVSSGAAVGAVFAIVSPLALPFGLGLQGAAFAGALAAGFGVYLIATRDGRTPVATLLLAGVAVQTLLGAAVSFLLLRSGESMRRIVYWLMGHLDGASWGDVTGLALVVPVLVVVLFAYARDLNVLLLGESDAGALGVNVARSKRGLLAVSSVLTAAAVAVSGVIGFVGLVVPHALRLVVGPDHRILLPTSALAGGSFLVAADTLARSGAAEVPVGIVTAAAGAPFFLYLLRTREVYEL
ncbi:vitamin B12 ABC transporter permease BtuC [Candidatus Halobonum tyrrellensis]|uniref:Corrinoid ABC transporter permease n=1 Tax=Candidatus Halobonum tyrrellensis G22 TaxID=1324957 RepID=V4HPN5_9EURY|nr:vitamin B12 ABC transporter permease BtuC [Candidatus Halobonum tyrrellensis]ESP89859.1 corrinoid ABC transporter permease [Candidatus Halobonum tyrrellensis G22]